MTSPILFAGGEDLDFVNLSGLFAWNVSNPTTGSPRNWYIDSTAGHFRSGYARYALTLADTVTESAFIRCTPAFSSSSFWTSARMFSGNLSGSPNFTTPSTVMRWADSNGIVRLQLKANTTVIPGGIILLQSVNSSGTATTLATSTGVFGTLSPGTPDKIDVFINYSVTGSFQVYSNGILIATFSGDVTTNSVTSLAYLDLGQCLTGTSVGTNAVTCWSEVIVATSSTLLYSVVTQAPTANGNTHNWDGGTAANAASNSMITGQVSPQFSGTAGQIQEYQVTPAIPSGSFAVISVVQKAQAAIGLSGPTKFDFMVRTGATDFTSSPDSAPTGAWATYVFNWDTNPNTTVAWLTSDLAASSTTFNMGLKSVT